MHRIALVVLGAGLAGLVACGGDAPPDPAVALAARDSQPGSDTHAAWSPDGTRIAFLSNTEGVRVGRPINFEIYVADADGGGAVRRTVNDAFDADVAWSPDGNRIAFKSYRDGNDEIYVLDLRDGSERNVTSLPGSSEGAPSWAPDGQTILFDSDRDGRRGLWLMDPAGGNLRRLPSDPGPGALAQWSPDGTMIAFMSDRDGNDEIYIAQADGSGVRRLTDDPRVNGYPRWHPDGGAVAHTAGAFDTDRWEVVLTGLDGTSGVLADSVDSGNAAWSPDGRYLVFGRYTTWGPGGGDDSRLHVLDVATGAVQRLR